MLARVLSAAANGIEAFLVEVEVNSGLGDTTVCNVILYSPNGFPPSVYFGMWRADRGSQPLLLTLFAARRDVRDAHLHPAIAQVGSGLEISP